MSKDFKDFKFDYEGLEVCPLCQNDVLIGHGKVNWHDFDFWYNICTKCGLKFMNPRPTQESYRDFYKNYFWEQKNDNSGFHQTGQMWSLKKYKWDNEKKWDPEEGKANRIAKQREVRSKIIIPSIAKSINLTKDSKILEIGCGYGATLDEFKKQYNCHVYAIEPSEEAKKVIQGFGVEIIGDYAEDLETISKTDQKFDAIIMSHVLENTTDPFSVMAWVKDSLSDDGVIYIQTPNLLLFDQMNPYHPFLFSRTSLGNIAKKVGLKYEPISDLVDRMLTVLMRKN